MWSLRLREEQKNTVRSREAPPNNSRLAQLGEHRADNAGVAGSSPALTTILTQT